MTNKQIMINNIDVSECECFSKYGHSCDLMRPFGFCSQWVNCYYKQLKRKEQECKRLKWYMQEIRMQELSHLDIEWDEYETHCANTEYSNIINLVEEALEERSPEDCRYGR